MPRKYKIMHTLKINEISAVDRPAQVGATMLILKRADKPMPKGKPYTAEQLANMTEEERRKAKMNEDTQKQIDELNKKLDDANTAAKAKDDKIAYLSKVNALSKAEREHFSSLGEAEQVAFVEKSSDDRALILKNLADANPVVYKGIDGSEYRKNDDPRLVAQAKRNDEMEKKLAKADALAKQHEYAKRAKDELGNVTGEDSTKTELLKAIDTVENEDERGKITKMLVAINKVASMAFDKIGTRGGAPVALGDEESQLDQLAEKYAAKHNVSHAVAYNKVLATPEGQRLYGEFYGKRQNSMDG